MGSIGFAQDKYVLVERATNMAAAAELNCLGMLGLSSQQLSTLKQWASGMVIGVWKHVEEVTVGGVLRSAITSKVELKTSAKSPAPHPEVRSPAVNKEAPARADFDQAHGFFMALSNWTMYVADYINHLRTVQPRPWDNMAWTNIPGSWEVATTQQSGKIDDSALSLEHVFVPIMPIMFKEGIGELNAARLILASAFSICWPFVSDAAAGSLMSVLPKGVAEPSLVMSSSAGNLLLTEQLRTLKEQHQNIQSCFAGDAGILTGAEACMSLTITHMNAVAHQWVQAADYVEPSGGRNQFCFAVRRSEQHGPEGTVSIEEESYGESGGRQGCR
eukprot:Skav221467  [mRNA]  locus=scaffold1700:397832:404795:+ [translate_table: standard]